MIFKRLWIAATTLGLLACANLTHYSAPPDSFYAAKLTQLLPADAILLGEQHDAPDHQRLHLLAVTTLVTQQTLAALALEMAPLFSRRVMMTLTVFLAQPLAGPTSATSSSGVRGPRLHRASMIWLSADDIFAMLPP